MISNKRKEYLRKYQLAWMKKHRQEWFDINGPCVKCGSRKRLELDHVDPKTKESHKIWSWSEERRNKELKKCQVLCYDCHKKKTAKENSTRLKGVKRPKLRTPSDKTIQKWINLLDSGYTLRSIGKIYKYWHSTVMRNIRKFRATIA